MDPVPKYFSVEIKTLNNLTNDISVHGYGYKRKAYTSNGIVKMESTRTLKNKEYGTILVKFPLNTFQTTNSSNYFPQTYSAILKQANKGSFSYNNIKIILYDLLKNNTIKYILLYALAIVGIYILGYFAIKTNDNKIKQEKIYSKKYGKDIYDLQLTKKERDSIPYFRDIPCKKDIFLAFFVSHLYGISKYKNDLFGAVLIKWIMQSYVSIVDKNKLDDEYIYSIQLKENIKFNNTIEQDLYDTLFWMSDKNNVITSEKIKNLDEKYDSIYGWIEEAFEKELNDLIDKKRLIKLDDKIYIQSTMLKEEAYKLYGLKKFLLDFTLIEEKQVLDVKLLEYYLIYAQIFGVAKRVSKQLKKIYPKFENEININWSNIFDICDINDSTRNNRNNINKLKSNSDNDGFRDNSSFGGGGGSAGGGSGGGIR